MLIPFIKPFPANTNKFLNFFNRAIEASHYSNFGPCEKKLGDDLGKLCESEIILAANATLILEGLHTCFRYLGLSPLLSKWTFPATNLAVDKNLRFFGKTSLARDTLGFSFFENANQTNYAVTTCPFGTSVPESYTRPNVKYWVVDNAAGASPDMHVVKAWLDKGADAVIVSLHATKGLSACEGGFVAFGKKSKDLFDLYKKYINFGFEMLPGGGRSLMGIGSNHKMSELSAAWCLAKLCDFEQEYSKRLEVSEKYLMCAKEYGLEYIYSSQAFWLRVRSNVEYKAIAHNLGFDVRPYYAPILDGANEDENADLLAHEGICLPTWTMDADMQKQALDLFKKSVDIYLSYLGSV